MVARFLKKCQTAIAITLIMLFAASSTLMVGCGCNGGTSDFGDPAFHSGSSISIASSDSGTEARFSADYLVSGTGSSSNFHTQLAAAIAALPVSTGSTMGSIRLEAGNYWYGTVNATSLVSNMKLHLDSGAVVKLANVGTTSRLTALRVISVNSLSNVVIEGGIFDGNRAGLTRVQVGDCTVKMISGTAMTNSLIQGVTFRNINIGTTGTSSRPLELVNSDNNRVVGCDFRSTNALGPSIDTASTGNKYTANTGFVTINSGSVTAASGVFQAVAHGLDITPKAENVQLTIISLSVGTPSYTQVSGISGTPPTATYIYVKSGNGAKIGWRVAVGE